MRWFALLFTVPIAVSAPCIPVDRDRIVAADIASTVVVFGQADPELVLGLAPLSGVHRTFSGHELAGIATRNGIRWEGPLEDVCFERRLTPLTADRIRTAIETTLAAAAPPSNDVRIDIVDFARQPVPSGELVFPRSGLTRPSPTAPGAPALWRGILRYTPDRTLSVWASVRMREERPLVIAARQIHYGAAISPDDIVLVRRDLFPFTPHLETALDALGRMARKTIAAGLPITNDVLEVPLDITAGDAVHVVCTNGSARITFDAVARSQGRKGDRILLLNPESHRSFRAFVDGKGSAHR